MIINPRYCSRADFISDMTMNNRSSVSKPERIRFTTAGPAVSLGIQVADSPAKATI
jgi:hypothetical protein